MGRKFMGQLDCVKGNVLVIQKDESDSNLAQKDSKDVHGRSARIESRAVLNLTPRK